VVLLSSIVRFACDSSLPDSSLLLLLLLLLLL
jgi:hypothetical protein